MKRYLIPKGAMSSGLHFSPVLFPSIVSFDFMFNESALCMNNVDQINKLAGMSFCLDHHKNSARIGWMVKNDHIELYAYWYKDSIRQSHYLGVAELNVRYESFVSSSYVSVAGLNTIQIGSVKTGFIGYLLFPYVGGTTPALEDVDIGVSYKG